MREKTKPLRMKTIITLVSMYHYGQKTIFFSCHAFVRVCIMGASECNGKGTSFGKRQSPEETRSYEEPFQVAIRLWHGRGCHVRGFLQADNWLGGCSRHGFSHN